MTITASVTNGNDRDLPRVGLELIQEDGERWVWRGEDDGQDAQVSGATIGDAYAAALLAWPGEWDFRIESGRDEIGFECAICAPAGKWSRGTVEIAYDPTRDSLPARTVYACQECAEEVGR